MRNAMMNLILLLVIALATFGFKGEEQHRLFTGLLSDHVKEDGVDYEHLCKDDRFGVYIDQLSKTDPEGIASEKEKFAFWLNAYNAFSLKAICDKYPIKSVNQLNFGGLIVSVMLKKTVWDQPLVVLNGQKYTLRQIDHEILRPTFKDPRIQFTIACGAIACPPLRKEAYEGAILDEQLTEQTRYFLSNPSYNRFDRDKKEAELSPLLNWSMSDFGENTAEMLLFVADFVPEGISSAIKDDPEGWKVKYKKYDLTLNDAKEDE